MFKTGYLPYIYILLILKLSPDTAGSFLLWQGEEEIHIHGLKASNGLTIKC